MTLQSVQDRITNNLLVLTVIIAILYGLTAKLGFILAIDPGNVTAIWPPSGIALAAALLFGWRAAPGIWLGSLLVNTWTVSGPLNLQISISIATGSLLQAIISAKILSLKREHKQFYLPSKPPVIFSFIFTTALTTVIAPTIGVISLWAGKQLGDIPLDLFKEPFNSLWWTWWIGDYAGILIFTPLCLKAATAQHFQRSRDSWLLPISSAIMGGTLINFFFIMQGYIADYEKQLQQDARILKIHVEDRLNKQLFRLSTMNAFFISSDRIDRDEFSTFVSYLIDEKSLTRMLEWVPAIRADERLGFEADIRQTGLKNFGIFETDAENNVIPAANRDWYFPILYAAPLTNEQHILGYDMGSEIIRLNAVQTARDSGKPTATGKLRLIQSQPGSDNPTILIFNPLYIDNRIPDSVEQRRANLVGFNLALISIKKLLPEAIIMAGLGELFVEIHDVTNPGTQRLLDSNFDRASEEKNNNIAPFKTTFSIQFANRTWEFIVQLPRSNLAKLHPISVWLILLAGIATTLIVVTYAHGRHQREQTLTTSELETRQLLEANPDGILVIDNNGFIVRSNHSVETLFGYKKLELLGQPINLLIPETSQDKHQSFTLDNMQKNSHRTGKNLEAVAQHKNGRAIPVDILLSPVTLKSEPLTMAVIRDISEKKAQQQSIIDMNSLLEKRVIERTAELVEEISSREKTTAELRKSQEEQYALIKTLQYRNNTDRRLSTLLKQLHTSTHLDESLHLMKIGFRDLIPDTHGAVIVEIQPGIWQTFMQWSPNNHDIYAETYEFKSCACQSTQKDCLQMHGKIENCTISEAINKTFMDHTLEINFFCSPQKMADDARAVVHLFGNQSLTISKLEARRERASDIISQAWLVMANLQLRDILQSQALRDGLTGLYNRRFLDDVLDKEISRSIRNAIPLAVAVVDIDYFKNINDQYGHTVGDLVLKKLSHDLPEHVRSSDYACRLGGEEFVLIMPDCTPEQANSRMESLRNKIASTPFDNNGRALNITISIGIAHCPQHGDNAHSLLDTADKALYRAKQSGRNRVVIAGEKINDDNNWEI